MTDFTNHTDEERESLYELARVGADCAARALSSILGHEIAACAPSVRQVDRSRTPGRWGTGVVFEVDGELSGRIAILLPTVSREVLGALLLGRDTPRDCEASTRSALRELGNIVASHTISAIADRLGGRILLSVPELVMEDADRVFADRLVESGIPRWVESELTDPAGHLHALLLFAAQHKP
jgi:chemotaxis protein CheY-P-specific phosphatase CheC